MAVSNKTIRNKTQQIPNTKYLNTHVDTLVEKFPLKNGEINEDCQSTNDNAGFFCFVWNTVAQQLCDQTTIILRIIN